MLLTCYLSDGLFGDITKNPGMIGVALTASTAASCTGSASSGGSSRTSSSIPLWRHVSNVECMSLKTDGSRSAKSIVQLASNSGRGVVVQMRVLCSLIHHQIRRRYITSTTYLESCYICQNVRACYLCNRMHHLIVIADNLRCRHRCADLQSEPAHVGTHTQNLAHRGRSYPLTEIGS
jgi:hypothetical protein